MLIVTFEDSWLVRSSFNNIYAYIFLESIENLSLPHDNAFHLVSILSPVRLFLFMFFTDFIIFHAESDFSDNRIMAT